MSDNGNKKFSLSMVRMLDLHAFLEGFSPADLGDLGTMRKVQRALEQLEKPIKSYQEKAVEIGRKADVLLAPFKLEIAQLNEQISEEQDPEKKKALEFKRDVLVNKANGEVKPLNEELNAFQQAEGKKKVSVEMNPEYFNKVVELFKKESMKKFKIVDACLEIADALGIEE